MKFRVKIAVVGLLAIIAAFLSAFALVDYANAEDRGAAVSCMTDGEQTSCFVLREYEGYVAVFKENELNSPMTVTNIQVSTLRELDKELLKEGIKLYSKERLMMTLEDLGS